MDKIKPIPARLKICSKCQWLFKVKKRGVDENCPLCDSTSLDARWQAGNDVYVYQHDQMLWFMQKMDEYKKELLKIIEEKSIKRPSKNLIGRVFRND